MAAAPQLEEDMSVAELLVRYVPSVSLHHVPGGGVPLVGSNHREVGRIAVTHLLERGRSVIGTVAGPFRRRVVRSRLRGAEEPINEAGAEVNEDLVVEADWTAAGASAATSLLLQREPKIDAIFVHSDLMAIGVLEASWPHGRLCAGRRRRGVVRRPPVRCPPGAEPDHGPGAVCGNGSAGRVAASTARRRRGHRLGARAPPSGAGGERFDRTSASIAPGRRPAGPSAG